MNLDHFIFYFLVDEQHCGEFDCFFYGFLCNVCRFEVGDFRFLISLTFDVRFRFCMNDSVILVMFCSVMV